MLLALRSLFWLGVAALVMPHGLAIRDRVSIPAIGALRHDLIFRLAKLKAEIAADRARRAHSHQEI